MKILYIAPYNTVGTLNLWKKAHNDRGNDCDFITLCQTNEEYDPGICLNLPLIKPSFFYVNGRHLYYKLVRSKEGNYRQHTGYPPTWRPNSILEKYYFDFRDWLWSLKIEPMIQKLKLLDYDIYHLEWGLEFYRDGRFVKKLKELNKPIICTYHGIDLRSRGVIPTIDRASTLNLTSELDLISKHPNLKYLFLPFETYLYNPSYTINKTIRICHSPRNRLYKGSDTIISICADLAKNYNVEFVLIENKSHQEALKIKQSCDILIDQIDNMGGWGYGMNSVEALSMGLCCMTELTPEYEQFIPDHPFININKQTLNNTLKSLIKNPEKIVKHKKKARAWVVQHHDLNNVTKHLYEYYQKVGIQ
tara:strand:- start:271 stop:1356 length:1086 start_codon:yes stop_codon:yes gene_type:complete